MKKIVIVTVLLGMFGFAVYDFMSSQKETVTPETPEEQKSDEVSKNVDTTSPDNDEESQASNNVGLSVGNIAPDFELKTLSGEVAKLSDYRGKLVMLNFWASWCPPCRAEMPDMEKFYQDKDVAILAVNLTSAEKNMKDVKQFVSEFGGTFPILLDKHGIVSDMYQIQPIPTSYMIDRQGIIRFKAFGALNYELMVQELEMMK